MLFAHDTEVVLSDMAALVNTLSDEGDTLTTLDDLDAFLRDHEISGTYLRTSEELALVRDLREKLRSIWTTPERDATAAIVNEILRDTNARPYLCKHDQWDWHLHVTEPDAPLAMRIGAEAAMAFLELIRHDDLGRLRHCAADDCNDVLVDLSKNHSKRYCDTGNCGNRANVAAYRARKRAHAG